MAAGHHPADAEAWAHANLTCIADADPQCLTAFAVYIAGLWGYWAATGDISGTHSRACLARDYAGWRLTPASVWEVARSPGHLPWPLGIQQNQPSWTHPCRLTSP